MDIPTEVTIRFDSKTLKMLLMRRVAREAVNREDTEENQIELHRIQEQLFERVGMAVLRITEPDRAERIQAAIQR